MARIFVSCPILDRPEFRMIDSVYQAIASCKEHQIRIYVHENDSLISRVRNSHLSVFMNDAKDFDYFISFDSDIEIINRYQHNNIFTKLVAHNKDFVGGLYALKNDGKGVACSSVPMEKGTIHYDSGLVRMRWLSSGCWCIKRSALEKMVAAYPDLAYDGDDIMSNQKLYGLYIPYLYTFQENGKTIKKYLSEDWAFTQRWIDIGGEIYADTSIALKHYGKRAYTLFDTDIITKIIQSGATFPTTMASKQATQVLPPVAPAQPPPVKTITLPAAGYDLKMENLCKQNNPKLP